MKSSCTAFRSRRLHRTLILLLACSVGIHSSGCVTITPKYSGTPDLLGNGVVRYNQPTFDNKVTWFGWLSYLTMTGAGAYGGYKSNLALKWDDNGYEVKPVGNAVLGGAAGLVVAGILTYALSGGSPPPVTQENAEKWLDKLDNDLLLIRDGSTSAGKRLDVLQAILPDADSGFVITSLADARLFRTMFPDSPYSDSVALAATAVIPLDSLPALAALFPSPRVVDASHRQFIQRGTTIAQMVEAATRYPEYASEAERKSARMVSTTSDAATFLRAFPASSHKEELGDSLLPKLRPKDIPEFIELFPSHSGATRLKQQMLDDATTIGDVLTVIRKYPELNGAGERKAARLASSAADYNRYLGAFPSGAARAEIERKLAEAMKIPECLDSHINSEYSEISPVISPDGKTLYFDRKYSPDNTGGEYDPDEVWYSTLDENGEWSMARRMPAPINEIGPTALQSVTPDGNTILVGGSETSVGRLSHRINGGWSDPEDIPMDGYYNLSDYYSVFLSNDGKTILMGIQQRDTRGDRDLYISLRREDGTWTSPRNLGPTINTKEVETSPYLAADGRTLYFASDGLPGGHGGRDIWMSRRLDDTWKKWSKPVNLGSPINTSNDESFFFLPASGDYAYYASTAGDFGHMDILRVALRQELRPNPVVLVSGTVTDRKTGNPVTATIIYERLEDGKEIGRARSEPKGGGYKIALPSGANYGFRAEADGYVAINDNLDLTKLASYEEQKHDLLLVPIEVGQSVRMNNLFFDFGKATLRSESFPELNRVADLLRSTPAMEVEIQGHTDNIGTDANNQTLSEARAEAVAAYLAARGIDRQRLAVKGYGASKPVTSNDTDAGRQQNRRVEFTITRK